MYKWALFALLIVSGALGLGVLFEEISARQAAAAAEKASGPTVKVVATNFQFDKPEYTAKGGEKTKISFNSKEGAHGLHITGEGGVDIKLDKQTTSADVTLKPGKYNIECNIPCGSGHANMKAVLVVS